MNEAEVLRIAGSMSDDAFRAGYICALSDVAERGLNPNDIAGMDAAIEGSLAEFHDHLRREREGRQ